MTKKNIELRAQLDSILEIISDDNSEKEINYEGYIINLENIGTEKKQPINDEITLENLMD